MSSQYNKAFSIIELLVVLVTLSLLIAIAIPQLQAVKRRAVDAASATNMRTHVQAVHLYTGDYKGLAPFIADPDATYSVVRGGGLTLTIEFFDSVEVWGVALADDYYRIQFGSDQWDENIDWSAFARPGPHGLLYQYSPTFFSRPEYWNENTRMGGQLRPTRFAQVRYPSSKAVFLELDQQRGFPIWRGSSRDRNQGWAFAMADGSVNRPAVDRLQEPCPLGEGLAHGGRFSFGVVGLHTQDGILGRDVN